MTAWNNIDYDTSQDTYKTIMKRSLKSAKLSSYYPTVIELPYSNNYDIQKLFEYIDSLEVIKNNIVNVPIGIISDLKLSHKLSSKYDYLLIKKTREELEDVCVNFNRTLDTLIENPTQPTITVINKLRDKLKELTKIYESIYDFFYSPEPKATKYSLAKLRFVPLSFTYNKDSDERKRALNKLNTVGYLNCKSLESMIHNLTSYLTTHFN